MVAMICPEKTGDKLAKLYHNQYMNAEGKWTTDFDHKATCRQDKVEILEYCKKVCILATSFFFRSVHMTVTLTLETKLKCTKLKIFFEKQEFLE